MKIGKNQGTSNQRKFCMHIENFVLKVLHDNTLLVPKRLMLAVFFYESLTIDKTPQNQAFLWCQ